MTDEHSEAATIPASDDGRKYAKLRVRIRAAIYDSIIFVIAMVLIIALATGLGSDRTAQIIGVAGVLFFVLYEPVMVWAKGGTLGHIACNLRVVDDRTLGNPSFWRASARFAIKAVLSWYSFVTMMASRRWKAIHDVLTRSTVQVRDINRIKRYDFAPAYSEPVDRKRPSLVRRVFSILVYSLLAALVFILLASLLEALGVMSPQCLDSNHCSKLEEWIFILLGFCLLASAFFIIGFGWRGRLFGFRSRR